LKPTSHQYTLAALIRTIEEQKKKKTIKTKTKKKLASKESPIVNVVLVSDLDMMASQILTMRDQPNQTIDLHIQNKAFLMNVFDLLVGEERFLEIRSRQTNHAPLKLIERRVRSAREEYDLSRQNLEQEIQKRRAEEVARGNKAIDAIKDEFDALREKKSTKQAALVIAEAEANKNIRALVERNRVEMRKLDAEFSRQQENNRQENERKLNEDRSAIQSSCKIWAVVIPPIPPLFVGLIVFIRRRLREREGVARSRLK